MDSPSGGGIRLLSGGGPQTRLGRVVVAGEVLDDVPTVDAPLRVMDAYVLSVVLEGRGCYRHEDGRERPIGPGSCTVIRPGVAHWYGTDRGERWTEFFVVFTGPIFDLYAERGILDRDGPRQPDPPPSVPVLRAALAATPHSALAAEHQLLTLADWLLDALRPEGQVGPDAQIMRAADRLAADLRASLDLHTLACELGWSYDMFRRRFKSELGVPPGAYRNAARLQAAAALVRHTDLTLRRIARILGYSDEFHLSRRFSGHFGASPDRYRHDS